MRRLRTAVLGVALGLAVMAGTVPAQADTATAVQIVQDAANQGVAAGYPGVIGLVKDGDTTTYVSSGRSIVNSPDPIDPTAQYRIGSNTKLYTTAVVLQLEAEGKLSLDDSVAKWLPNAVNTSRYDGRTITIRQLLNHTSGLPEYMDHIEVWNPFGQSITLGGIYANGDLRNTHYTPQYLVNVALSMDPRPKGVWHYANTNYVLAGMIIQAVTGHDPAVEFVNRIIAPLGLTGTYFASSDVNLYGNYVHGWHYGLFNVINDVSPSNVEIFWTSGAMVSTLKDQATFVSALLKGQLLPPAQMAELKTTVPDESGVPYGLAMGHPTLACGQTVWAHGGAVAGYNNRWYASDDGSKVVVILGNVDDGKGDTPGVEALRSGARGALCAMLS